MTDDDLAAMTPGTLIVDVSCDEGMGFSWARPTTFAEPTFVVGDNVLYYAVDHSPSYLWNSATWEISEALLPFLPTVMGGPGGLGRRPDDPPGHRDPRRASSRTRPSCPSRAARRSTRTRRWRPDRRPCRSGPGRERTGVLTLLAEQPILLLALLLLVGTMLGRVRAGHRRDRAGRSALRGDRGVSHRRRQRREAPDPRERRHPRPGPVHLHDRRRLRSELLRSLRRGWPVMLSVVATIAVVAVAAVLVGRALGLTMSVVAGAFTGALTNTPALAAATERAADPAGPKVATRSPTSGSCGVALAASWSLRHRGNEAPPASRSCTRRSARNAEKASPSQASRSAMATRSPSRGSSTATSPTPRSWPTTTSCSDRTTS